VFGTTNAPEAVGFVNQFTILLRQLKNKHTSPSYATSALCPCRKQLIAHPAHAIGVHRREIPNYFTMSGRAAAHQRIACPTDLRVDSEGPVFKGSKFK
jgi:hypothetical protein